VIDAFLTGLLLLIVN